MYRSLIILISFYITTFVSINLFARDGLNGSIGIKTIYAKDEQIQQNYFKPFAAIGWSGSSFEIKGTYYRWFSYTITNELLNTREININQPVLSLSVYPLELIDLDFSVSYYTGDFSFKAYRLFGGLTINLEKTELAFDYSYKADEYDFGGAIEKINQNISTELSVNFTGSASWDISYSYENIDYTTYGYIYNKHSARTGFVYLVSRNFFILGGIAGSVDSYDIASAIADAGFTVKIYDHIKLGAMYIFTEEFYKTTSTGSGPGSNSSSSISTQSVHSGSFFVTLYF